MNSAPSQSLINLLLESGVPSNEEAAQLATNLNGGSWVGQVLDSGKVDENRFLGALGDFFRVPVIFNFSRGSSLSSRNDCAGVPHTSSRWGCHACDKSCHRFFAIGFDPCSRFFFRRATDFADQDHRGRSGILVEKLYAIEMRQAV